MTTRVVALYARVSSAPQAAASTIHSQVAALRERSTADGRLLLPEYEFVDDGYSGATLLRPALERLRDAVVARGGAPPTQRVPQPGRKRASPDPPAGAPDAPRQVPRARPALFIRL